MNEVMNLFGQVSGPQSFDQIRISIASPEQVLSWSYGEIKKPETIVHSSLKKVVCSVHRFLVRLRITNACAVNTNV